MTGRASAEEEEGEDEAEPPEAAASGVPTVLDAAETPRPTPAPGVPVAVVASDAPREPEPEPEPDGTVFVGGFLVLHAEDPEDETLRLPRDVVTRAVAAAGGPGRPPLALNLNHDEGSTVGRVRRLVDADAGLFCLAEICSPSFLDIVRRAAGRSKLVARGPRGDLRADPVVEYLSAGYPALSLSSAALDAVCEGRGEGAAAAVPPADVFRHVSLCGLGRRRGTLAVYGRDPRWIVGRFPGLSAAERQRVVDAAAGSAVDALGAPAAGAADPFRSDPYGLLAGVVDDAYIAERLRRLRYDKHILGLGASETYVKASELPDGVVRAAPARIIRRHSGGDGCPSRPVVMSQAPAALVPANALLSAPVPAPGANPAVVAAAAAPPPSASSAAPPSDCVYLSRDAFLSILESQRGVPSSSPSPSPSGPVGGAATGLLASLSSTPSSSIPSGAGVAPLAGTTAAYQDPLAFALRYGSQASAPGAVDLLSAARYYAACAGVPLPPPAALSPFFPVPPPPSAFLPSPPATNHHHPAARDPPHPSSTSPLASALPPPITQYGQFPAAPAAPTGATALYDPRYAAAYGRAAYPAVWPGYYDPAAAAAAAAYGLMPPPPPAQPPAQPPAAAPSGRRAGRRRRSPERDDESEGAPDRAEAKRRRERSPAGEEGERRRGRHGAPPPPSRSDSDEDPDEPEEAGEDAASSVSDGRRRLKLPGERGYRRGPVGRRGVDGDERQELGEMRAALREIRRDLSEIRSSGRSAGAAAGSGAAEEDVGSSDQPPAQQQQQQQSSPSPPSGMAVAKAAPGGHAPSVLAPARANPPPSRGLPATAGAPNSPTTKKIARDLARAAGIGGPHAVLPVATPVNASCEPMDTGGEGPSTDRTLTSQEILDMNRRVFVSLLNQLE